MTESIKFGDIFLYKEKEYVFLANTTEMVYAAVILDAYQTQRVRNLDDLRTKRTDSYKSDRHPLFCYVILSTEEFKGRMAHFNNPAKDNAEIVFDKTGLTLNREDIQNIKREICDPDSPIPGELRQLVAPLDIA